jgi:cytochrome c1
MDRLVGTPIVVLLMAFAGQTGQAQAPASVALADVQRLKCTFTQKAVGTWDKALAPTIENLPAKLSIVFDAIDTQDGTANVTDVTAPDAGAPHITVRVLANNLHFLAMNISGSVYLTTVFADRESRTTGNFKAVHTRHEFTPTRLTGWTSRPEQYYGQCEVLK